MIRMSGYGSNKEALKKRGQRTANGRWLGRYTNLTGLGSWGEITYGDTAALGRIQDDRSR